MLKRRNTSDVEEIITETQNESESTSKIIDYSKLISTGSTLLDLAISGNKGGGIPGGIIVEIFGAPGSGKTAILSEIGAYAQSKGGQVLFLDPESRFDQEYARIYGINLDKNDYHKPDTVTEMFDFIYNWQPSNKDKTNVIVTDSLAALSTKIEMEEADKMGMRRAKEFSEGLRKTARVISNNGWIIACSNQVREGTYGEVTPGGQAIPFYSSLRIKVKKVSDVSREIDYNGKKVKKIVGIESSCFIKKSTVDDPHRECRVFITFGYGIDDVRGNLQYCKDMTKDTKYDVFNDKSFVSMEKAILYIEENELQQQLKNKTINLWKEIEEKFKSNRKPKER